MAYIKDGGTGEESAQRLRGIVLGGGETTKKKTKEKAKITNLEPEITAVITKKEYEEAGGDINKILNNTPEDLFEVDAPSKTQQLEELKEEQVLKASGKPKKLENTKKELRRKIGAKKQEEVIPEEDEYKTQLLDEEENSYIYSQPMLIHLASGEKITVDKPNFRIGIAPDNDYVIAQDMKSHTISRHHMSLSIKNDTVYIKDESSNGTYIGRDAENPASFFRLPKGNAVELKDKQFIKIAGELFMFIRNEADDE